MRKTTHKQFVQTSLEMMFATIRHNNQSEREVRRICDINIIALTRVVQLVLDLLLQVI